MRREIESAADFLSNLLRLHSSVLSLEQLEAFRESILSLLTGHYHEHWFPEKPFKGSAYRCLRINHKMDPIIAKAGTNCGLDEGSLRGVLPNELTLWIDPKEVSYRIGENGSICVLFDGKRIKEEQGEQEDQTTATSAMGSTANNESSALKNGDNNKSSGSVSNNNQIHNKNFVKNVHNSNMVSSVKTAENRNNNLRENASSPSSLSSTTSSLSSPSPSSSPDWCIDRNSPDAFPSSPKWPNQTPFIQFPVNTGLMNGVDVNNYANGANAAAFMYNVNLVNGHQQHTPPQPQQQRFPPQQHSFNNHWAWANSRMENNYTLAYHHQQPVQYQFHGRRQVQQQQHQQSTSPLSHHHGFSGWDNFVLDRTIAARHHSHFTSNLEQLAAYVSS